METIYICILTLLGVFGMMIWLVFHFHRVQTDLETGIRSVKLEQEGIRARIIQLDDEQKKLRSGLSARKGDEKRTPAEDHPLTLFDICSIIRAAGYVQESLEGGVIFKKEDQRYVIDARRIPRITLRLGFRVDPDEWNLERLRRATLLLSEEDTMVEARVSDETDGNGAWHLAFMLTTIDRTNRAFRENFRDYLDTLDHAQERLKNLYNQLSPEGNEQDDESPMVQEEIPVCEGKPLLS